MLHSLFKPTVVQPVLGRQVGCPSEEMDVFNATPTATIAATTKRSTRSWSLKKRNLPLKATSNHNV